MLLFYKQKTAYYRRISDWRSDVCAADLGSPSSTSASAPVAIASAAPALDLQALLIGIVAERTGYPHEMLGLEADLEASGRASCRERVCQYVSISVVAVSLTKHNTIHEQLISH